MNALKKIIIGTALILPGCSSHIDIDDNCEGVNFRVERSSGQTQRRNNQSVTQSPNSYQQTPTYTPSNNSKGFLFQTKLSPVKPRPNATQHNKIRNDIRLRTRR